MSEDIRVTTAHVRELAARQGQAGAEVAAATELIEGVDTSVRWSHGVIAWSAAAAVEEAQHARRAAGAAMTEVSRTLDDRLSAAAAQYDAVDASGRRVLDAQLRPR